MFGKMIRFSQFRRTGFKCENLITLPFNLQVLSDRLLKLIMEHV